MKALFACVVLTIAAPAIAMNGPISKFDDAEIDDQFDTATTLFDMERCLIDLTNMTAPLVYRQPDEPDRVTIVWTGSYGQAMAKVELSRQGDRTSVRSWLGGRKDQIRKCGNA